MKDKQINYRGLSQAQLHSYILETWQEHFLEKRVSKDFKRHQSMYSPSFCKNVAKIIDWGCGAHNQGHLADSYKCHKSKQKKGFYSSLPRYHPEKPYKHKRRHKYHVSKQYNKPHHKRFVKHRLIRMIKKHVLSAAKKAIGQTNVQRRSLNLD